MPPEGITNFSDLSIRHTTFSACFCRQREVVLLSWRGCWWGGCGPPTELANMKLRHQHPFLGSEDTKPNGMFTARKPTAALI